MQSFDLSMTSGPWARLSHALRDNTWVGNGALDLHVHADT